MVNPVSVNLFSPAFSVPKSRLTLLSVRLTAQKLQDKAVNVVRLKEGESAPVPDPSTTGRGLGGVSLSATGRPQRKTRGKGGQPIVVTCSSDETLNFFKLKASYSFHPCVSLASTLTSFLPYLLAIDATGNSFRWGRVLEYISNAVLA